MELIENQDGTLDCIGDFIIKKLKDDFIPYNLRTVSGNLSIIDCNNITDFYGLENLESVGNDFTISNCENVYDFTGLEKLKYIGNDLYIGHSGFIECKGLSSLSIIGNTFDIVDCSNFKFNGINPFIEKIKIFPEYRYSEFEEVRKSEKLKIIADFLINL